MFNALWRSVGLVRFPETRYAIRPDRVHVAYQVVGDGPVTLVWCLGWISHLDLPWTDPRLSSFFDRLMTFCRLVIFNKAGTGRDAGRSRDCTPSRATSSIGSPTSTWCRRRRRQGRVGPVDAQASSWSPADVFLRRGTTRCAAKAGVSITADHPADLAVRSVARDEELGDPEGQGRHQCCHRDRDDPRGHDVARDSPPDRTGALGGAGAHDG